MKPKNKNKLFQIIMLISLLSAFLIIVLLYLFIKKTNFKEGEKHDILQNTIAKDILNESYLGLIKYKVKYGNYPNTNGKYFLDSIIYFMNKKEPYIYFDTLSDENKIITIGFGIQVNPALHDSIYFGIGNPQYYINYYKFQDSFLLYYVGFNGIDEFGKGDDLLYNK